MKMTTINRLRHDERVTRAVTLCALALAAMLFQAQEARAQWSAPDAQGNISSTNTGNVLIGTTTSTKGKLEIRVDMGVALGEHGIVYVSRGGTGSGGVFMGYRANGSAATGGFLRGTANLPLFVGTTGAPEAMTITDAGSIGVGTAAPSGKFDVTTTNAANVGSVDLMVRDGVMANSNPVVISHKVGTTNGALTRIGFNAYSTTDGGFGVVNSAVGGWAIQSDTRNGITAPSLQFTSFTTAPVKNDVLTLQQGGNVGIGTTDPASKLHVVGDITVTGNINAKYQDVAEWVPTTQKLQAGTVVILDTRRDNHVAASTTEYDTRVAGVVSAQPGISLGEAGEGKALVATTGRVKVKVDATRTPIRVGDLLVTSGRSGYAMRSEPLKIGRRRFHSPGTIIGKALESLEKGTGEILVLLSLQ